MSDTKKKTKQGLVKQNVIESLKDLGATTGTQMQDLLSSTSEDFIKELIGLPRPQKKVSGEISVGETLEMSQAVTGKSEENKKLKLQISYERQMSQEEKRISQEKLNQLRVHLQALTSEVAKLAEATQGLAKETQEAAFLAPANPGVYHITFFEKIITFLQSFRKKIEESSTWLQGSNKRAEKKNYWAMYKKKGSSFLLSPDHYLQRSAG